MMKRTAAVYVDVDGTLLLWPGKPGRVPRQGEPGHGEPPKINRPLADALRRWHSGDRCLVLWSRGGKAHCEYAANLCELKPDACLPKPDMAFDDAPRTVTVGEPKGFRVIGPHNWQVLT